MTPHHLPPVIGLAGGIGAGKSHVAGVLCELGCLVFNADDAARAELDDPAVRDELVTWWGDDLLDESGRVNRAAVAAIVFRDPEQRRRLEALIHPRVERRRVERFAAAPPGTPALVIDAPLLYEAELEALCDVVFFVDASRAVRLARVSATRGWDDDELTRRERSQMPLDSKRSLADHVIRNEGDDRELRDRLAALLAQLAS